MHLFIIVENEGIQLIRWGHTWHNDKQIRAQRRYVERIDYTFRGSTRSLIGLGGHYIPQHGHYIPQHGHYIPQHGHYMPQHGHYMPQHGRTLLVQILMLRRFGFF